MPKLKMFSQNSTDVLSIAEVAKTLSMSEEDVRIALMGKYDDFDTRDTCKLSDVETLIPKQLEDVAQHPKYTSPASAPAPSPASSQTRLQQQILDEIDGLDKLLELRNRVAENLLDNADSQLNSLLTQRWEATNKVYMESVHSLLDRAKQVQLSPLLSNQLDGEISYAMKAIEGKYES